MKRLILILLLVITASFSAPKKISDMTTTTDPISLKLLGARNDSNLTITFANAADYYLGFDSLDVGDIPSFDGTTFKGSALKDSAGIIHLHNPIITQGDIYPYDSTFNLGTDTQHWGEAHVDSLIIHKGVLIGGDLFLSGRIFADEVHESDEIKIALVTTADENLVLGAGESASPGTNIDTVTGVPTKNATYIGDIVIDPSLDSQVVELKCSFSITSTTNNVTITGYAKVNSTEVQHKVLRKISSGSDVGAVPYLGIMPVTGGDTIGFYLMSDLATTLTIKQGASWLMESWEYIHDEP